MTATLTRIDPFTDAECRRPGRNPRWWDDGANMLDRRAAAAMCAECPALVACATAAVALGSTASGTWAGTYRHYQTPAEDDGDAMSEFLAVFGPTATVARPPGPTHTEQDPKPVRHGRYWLHPAQLTIEYQEAN